MITLKNKKYDFEEEVITLESKGSFSIATTASVGIRFEHVEGGYVNDSFELMGATFPVMPSNENIIITDETPNADSVPAVLAIPVDTVPVDTVPVETLTETSTEVPTEVIAPVEGELIK